MVCHGQLNLQELSKPVRYIGQEWNQVNKKIGEVNLRIALAFPDVYEIGMSHLGLKILYHLINNDQRFYAERVFAPWPDREEQLRSQGKNICSLETKTALQYFDILGFSLQYELSYTNVLTMIDLAGLQLKSKDREGTPLIIAGGPNTFNPEPLADFIDCFFIGDAEDSILEALEMTLEAKEKDWPKELLLENMAKIEGVYVPCLYNVKKQGLFYGVEAREEKFPTKIKKRLVKSLEESFYPREILVPYTKTVHDRVALEISRGCVRGCRFCQAGMIYRPQRERSPQLLEELADSLLKTSGYNEVSLLSLSSTDYSSIKELVTNLTAKYRDLGIGLALPSLRADAFSIGLAQEIQEVRKAGLTFAPEAGSQRLRDIINKGVEEEDLLEAASAAFKAGWSSLKLYFMIGLPLETDEDVEAIVELAHKVRRLGVAYAPRKPQITVSISTFIPKPHTPFQWQPLLAEETILRRQGIVKEGLRGKAFKVQWNDWEISLLEALFSRGDRRLGNLLLKAWQNGCRFDSWGEYFKPDIWWQAIEEEGLPWQELMARELAYDEPLPWDHIDTGLNRDFLKQEMQKALLGTLTESCLEGLCHGCGCCQNLKAGVEIFGGKNSALSD